MVLTNLGTKENVGSKENYGSNKKIEESEKNFRYKNVKSQMVPDSIRTCQIVPESAW